MAMVFFSADFLSVWAAASLPPTPHSTFVCISVACVHRGQNMSAMPILHLNDVIHQSSIRYGSYALDPHLQVSLEKRIKQAKKAFFKKIPEET
jgi:hypothetical protein